MRKCVGESVRRRTAFCRDGDNPGILSIDRGSRTPGSARLPQQQSRLGSMGQLAIKTVWESVRAHACEGVCVCVREGVRVSV